MPAVIHRCFGSFRLDPAGQSLWRDDQPMVLTPKAFAILAYLSERPGQLITKAEFFEQLWPKTAVGDAALSVCMSEVRRILGDNPQAPRFIETVHTRGYRFIAEVSEPAPVPSVGEVPNGNQLMVRDKSWMARAHSRQATYWAAPRRWRSCKAISQRC